MKRILRNIVVVLFSVLLVSIIIGVIFLWQVDPRLQGKFRSNSKETIANINKSRTLTERQITLYSQIYGNLTYEVNGHKVLAVMEKYSIKDPAHGTENTYEKTSSEHYFVMIKKDKNKAIVLFAPKISIFDFELTEIEFTKNGFWLLPYGGNSTQKEKFNKINS